MASNGKKLNLFTCYEDLKPGKIPVLNDKNSGFKSQVTHVVWRGGGV
jgi:hypothetical protein